MPRRVSSAISVRTARQALVGVRLAGRLAAPRLVRRAEPLRPVQRLVEDPLQLRRARRPPGAAASSRRAGLATAPATAASISRVGVRAVGHGGHHRRRWPPPSPPSPTAPAAAASSRAADLRPIVAGPAARRRPARARRRRHGRRRRASSAVRRPRDRADRRLLHADRRRPVRLRPDRRHQRALRRLRDGRQAADGAEPRRLPLERRSAPTCSPRSCAAAPTPRPPPARAIVGGHSIDDPEPKYGLAVTGTVHPDRAADQRRRPGGRRARAHQAARAPGAVATAIKRGLAGRRARRRAAIEVMTTLNAAAAEQARGRGRARADRRHRLRPARPPARARRGQRRARPSSTPAPCPAIDGVLDLLADERAVAGGSRRNRADAEGFTRRPTRSPEERAGWSATR